MQQTLHLVNRHVPHNYFHQLYVNQASNASSYSMYDSSGVDNIKIRANGYTYFNGGNIGIGTTSPANLLHIKGAQASIALEDTDDLNGMQSLLTSHSNGILYFDVNMNSTGTSGSVQFRADGASKNLMTLANSGNVGIGTATPSAKLHIKQSSELAGGGLRLERSADTNVWDLYANSAAYLNIAYNTSDIMTISNGGNVGIGTTSPSHKLHVVGTAGLSTGTAWTNTSDIRLKDVRGKYEHGLDAIMKLNTIRFNYKEGNPLELPSDKEIVGFIAQEVKEVIPEAVVEREDGYLELNVDPIHWALVNATQEQQEQIETNKHLLKTMQGKHEIETKVNNVQDRKIASLEQENRMMKQELKEIRLLLESLKK